MEGALLRARCARKVYLAVSRVRARAPRAGADRALRAAPNVSAKLGTVVTERLGDESGVTAVRIRGSGDVESELELDGLFVEIGADPQVELLVSVGVALNRHTGRCTSTD